MMPNDIVAEKIKVVGQFGYHRMFIRSEGNMVNIPSSQVRVDSDLDIKDKRLTNVDQVIITTPGVSNTSFVRLTVHPTTGSLLITDGALETELWNPTTGVGSPVLPGALEELKNVPVPTNVENGMFLRTNVAGSIVSFTWATPAGASGTGVSNFIELTDVPNNYSGQANKFVKVKGDATGLEFVSQADATETTKGLLQIADNTEANAGTRDDRAMTPAKVASVLNLSGIRKSFAYVNPAVDTYQERYVTATMATAGDGIADDECQYSGSVISGLDTAGNFIVKASSQLSSSIFGSVLGNSSNHRRSRLGWVGAPIAQSIANRYIKAYETLAQAVTNGQGGSSGEYDIQGVAGTSFKLKFAKKLVIPSNNFVFYNRDLLSIRSDNNLIEDSNTSEDLCHYFELPSFFGKPDGYFIEIKFGRYGIEPEYAIKLSDSDIANGTQYDPSISVVKPTIGVNTGQDMISYMGNNTILTSGFGIGSDNASPDVYRVWDSLTHDVFQIEPLLVKKATFIFVASANKVIAVME